MHRRTRTALVTALGLAALGLPVAAHADTDRTAGYEWQQRSEGGGITPRGAFGAAYDAAHDRVVVFGGARAGFGLDDTWTWDGAAWTELQLATAPSPRSDMAFAYDAGRDELVLFSGDINQYRDTDRQTWVLDEDGWEQQFPVGSPRGTSFGEMVYDPVRDESVLLRPRLRSNERKMEVWTWDGSTWRRERGGSPPPARKNFQAAWDPSREAVVLHGGNRFLIGGATEYRRDTWAWNGKRWRQLPDGPTRSAGGMAAVDDRLALFGGIDHQTRMDDTWVLGRRGWREVEPVDQPSARSSVRMVHDSARDQALLLGGLDGELLTDVWALRRTSPDRPAHRVADQIPPAAVAGAIVP